MQLEEIYKLSDKELRIKVAELDGFKPVERAITGTYMENVDGMECIIPDYPNDLNYCYKIEESHIYNTKNEELIEVYESNLELIAGGWIIHANAKQRCQAFLLTMGEN